MTEHDARLQTITTVQPLADYLNVSEKWLRHQLRAEFPKQAPGQGGQWQLTPAMNRRMAELALNG